MVVMDPSCPTIITPPMALTRITPPSPPPCLHSTRLPYTQAVNFLPLKCPSERSWIQGSRLQSKVCVQQNNVQGGTVIVDVEDWIKKMRDERLEYLEKQALDVLTKTLNVFTNSAFPCALITGDVVILDLLHRLGALQNGRVKVIFVDTFHLFPETYTFLQEVEEKYGFKTNIFHAAGVDDKDQYIQKFGSDLYIRDIEEYDRVCKVEPFNRALQTYKVDAMINGRRRDHGAERGHLEVFEGGQQLKVQPLAYWEFRDCWDYLKKYGIPYHPLHDQGYPSIGDIQSTLPVSKEKWFEYGGERSGRFQGLKNKDGSVKTECGIHVET